MEKIEELSKCELEVMKAIWDAGKEVEFGTLQRILNNRLDKDWKPTTITSFLARLKAKGYITAIRRGYYIPTVKRDVYREREVLKFINAFYKSPEELINDVLKVKEIYKL